MDNPSTLLRFADRLSAPYVLLEVPDELLKEILDTNDPYARLSTAIIPRAQ